MRNFFVLLLLVLVVTISFKIVFPKFLKRIVLSSLVQNCPDCAIGLEAIEIKYFPIQVQFINFYYGSGNPKATRVEVRTSKIIAHLSRTKLFKGVVYASKIEWTEPQFIITEGDLRSAPDESSAPGSDLRSIAMRVETFLVSGGSLSYSRVHKGKIGLIRLKKINGAIEVGENEINSTLSGKLENSGSFVVTVKLPRTLSNIDLDVGLKILDQNLVDLNPYFHPTDGILLTGTLHKGQSHIQIRDNKLKGWVDAKYLGLGVKFEKTRARNAITTLILNIAKSISLETGNIGQGRSEQRRSVKIKRIPNEAVLHFIFRGMAKAALQVAS